MLKRILIGIIGIPTLLFLLLSNFYNGILLFILLLIISITGTYELLYMFSLKKIKLNKLLSYTTVILTLISFYISAVYKIHYMPYLIFILNIFIYGIYLIITDKLKNAINELSSIAFFNFYLGILLGHIFLLKHLPNGNYFLLLIVLLIWFSDSAAYFGGTLLGRKKLLPFKASPNKSYMGLYFAIGFSVISIYFTNFIMKIHIFSNLLILIIGFIFGFIVIFSDLIESIIKRSANVKDSKSLFPGHGGVLDIFDSWFFAIPLFYYFVKLLYFFKAL